MLFYFTLKALFILNIFKFLFSLYGHAENGLIRKIRLIYDVTAWLTNNCYTHIVQYLKQ